MYSSIKDIIFEVNELHFTDLQCKELFDELPDNIRYEGLRWGLNDTIFKDKLYAYIKGIN